MPLSDEVYGLDRLLRLSPPRRPGAYQLIIHMPGAQVRVGALGVFTLSPGTYVYTGSALGGVRQRVLRHLDSARKLRWHVDYVTKVGHIVGVRVVLSDQRLECTLHAEALAALDAEEPLPGFGASDCRCRSHLLYLAGLADPGELIRRLEA